ncbi:uncharacterized protein PFL1_00871 [Pseudozyma flocculosa PF-1]|uniref:Related to steroid 5alpha-reductase n=1 Tax=Pseudozyma flocculosa TaxID=84751 RepID=A0A5C3F2G4_9BASI|nr:uncharacterized protein PFL1_00871 [Pseudozyma flocculosa PF-1]EPQ31538.1 hypothetical protein PFL1_00871 [Pseudozyma flocculosa PF-1]SPO38674.1 related to steroid 5alpha-reductase [Pseudozyma flocculosa]
MAIFAGLLDFLGLNAVGAPPFSPASFYSLVLFSFKTWPFLSPLLSKINAPHGRFSFDSILNVNGNLAWFLMEIPSPLMFLAAVSSPPLSHEVRIATDSTWPSLPSLLSPSLRGFLSLPSANQVLALLYLTHYLHRAVLSPLRSPRRSAMHISVPLFAIVFNLINGFLMGSWIGGRSPWSALPTAASASAVAAASHLPDAVTRSALFSKLSGSLAKPQALDGLAFSAPGLIPSSVWSSPLWYLGLAGWAIGFASNVWHDEILLNLRRPKAGDKQEKGDEKAGKPKYEVPYGGLYRFISYPNYASEWFEWFSYSLAAIHALPLFSTASLSTAAGLKDLVATLTSIPPFLFALVEVSVMLPRAVNGHKWYQKTFGERYPRERKAVIAFVL